MTDITPLLRSDQKIIQAYASGRFKISGVSYDHAVIVTSFTVDEWKSPDIDNLNAHDFAALKNDTDVLLIGSGKTGKLLMPKKRAEFKQAGLSLEIMDTGAACRTFNVLTAEGRRVAAALLPVNKKT